MKSVENVNSRKMSLHVIWYLEIIFSLQTVENFIEKLNFSWLVPSCLTFSPGARYMRGRENEEKLWNLLASQHARCVYVQNVRFNNMKVKVVNEGALKENLLGNVIEYGHNDEDIQRWEMDAKVVGDENGVKNYSNLLNEITNFF